MNLYKLSQNINEGYDTYDSCVVCAKNENEARMIHPSRFVTHYDDKNWFGTCSGGADKGKEYITEDNYYTWVPRNEVKKIKVELIGVAKKGLKRGLIVSSFNAG
jgi:hypothetical protein